VHHFVNAISNPKARSKMIYPKDLFGHSKLQQLTSHNQDPITLGKKAREFDEARQEFLARLRRDVVRAEMARVIRISTFVAVRELQKRREIRRMSLLHPGRLRQCGGRY
ncbi:MAG TPA: hypothetical protein PKJ97_01095, partial [Candidatus Bilamarchaeaceae archaeon]|nr:hypothetical protein [Candidatus Bilamarchaeaceae archaeon]